MFPLVCDKVEQVANAIVVVADLLEMKLMGLEMQMHD